MKRLEDTKIPLFKAAIGSRRADEHSGPSTFQQEPAPECAAFLDFFLNEDGRPFFRVKVNAVPGKTAEIHGATQAYGAFMAPWLLMWARSPVLTTDVIVGLTNTLGPRVENADRPVVVRCRSRRDFLEIVSTREFRAVVEDKATSLGGRCSAPATVGATVSVPVLARVVVMAVGGVATILARLSSQMPTRRRLDIRSVG